MGFRGIPGDGAMTFTDDMTLREARDELRELVDEGHRCPCCTQFAKVYRRNLPSASAQVMIALYHAGGDREFVFLPDVLETVGARTAHQGGYGTLGQFWGLMERQAGEREDGSNRVGWWRLTALGRDFVLGRATVPKYARLYNGRCLGVSGEPITINAALGAKFDYRELMGWRWLEGSG